MRQSRPLYHAAASSGGGPDKAKLALAGVLLLVAGGAFAWYFGLFGGSKPSRKLDNAAQQQMQEQFEEQKQENERLRKEAERKGTKIEEG